MRIEVKKVRQKSYVQFLDRDNHRYHLGSAEDFDSWFLGMLFWSQQLEEETAVKRQKFFESMQPRLNEFLQLSEDEKSAFQTLWSEYSANRLRLKLLLPKRPPFMEFEQSTESSRPKWVWNTFGKRLRPRVRELYLARKRFTKKAYMNAVKRPDNVKALIKARNVEAYNYVHIRPYGLTTSQERIFAFIRENTQRKRAVSKKSVINSLRNELDPSFVELEILQMLRQGILFEPNDGLLSIT